MKKLLSLSLLPVLLAGCSGSSGEPKTADTEKPFVVGAILPLSGNVANIGESIQNGIDLALADLPEDLRAKLEVKFEDDQFQPAQTVTALRKLQSIDKPGAIILAGSTPANAVAPLVEKAKLVTIAFASDKKIAEGREWVVRHWVRPTEEAKVLIPEMQRRGYKKIAVATGIHDGMLAVDDAFRAVLPADIEIVVDARFQPDERNFKTFTLQSREAGADAIFANLVEPASIGLLARQAREQGYEGEFFGVEMLEDKSAVDLAAGHLTNAWYAQASDPEGNFLTRYQAAYPDAGFVAAANAYDTIRIIADAVSEFTPGMTDEERRAAVNERLHTLRDYSGAAGTYSASGENDFTLPAMLKVVREDGTFAALASD